MKIKKCFSFKKGVLKTKDADLISFLNSYLHIKAVKKYNSKNKK
jgi:hypothetical protein